DWSARWQNDGHRTQAARSLSSPRRLSEDAIQRSLILTQFQFCDGRGMHFIGTVSQTKRSSACPRVRKQKILADSSATVRLNGAVDDPQCHVGRNDFYHRDLCSSDFVAYGIHHVSGFQSQQARLLDLHPRRGDVGSNRALFREGLSKSGARAHALAHRFQRALGQSYQPHAVMNTARTEPALSDFETSPFTKQHI